METARKRVVSGVRGDEEMNREEKQKEIAHSYFELSKIFATLTGFFAVTSGLFLQISLFNLDMFLKENNDKNLIYGGAYINLFWAFISISVIFLIFTFVKWKKGKKILDKT